MYEYISGRIVEIGSDYAVSDMDGIGYVIYCSKNTLCKLNVGEVHKLYIYLHIAEDAMALYGFYTTAEREMFKKLIAVSRIGKKTAQSVLCVMTPQDVMLAVATDNVAAFDNVQGMGRKTAQRVILELKEKVDLHSVQTEGTSDKMKKDNMVSDAVEALLALGYDGISAGRAVAAVKEFSSTEVLIKKALAEISSKK